jgi:DMSO/TMAO reductase YedYZ molybdopterin-dependent catalytic subunit
VSKSDDKALLDELRGDDAGGDGRGTAGLLGERRVLGPELTDDEARRQMLRRSRRSFLVGGIAALGGWLSWMTLSDATKGALYRRAFEFNERVSQMFFTPRRLAKEFRPDQVTEVRVNGDIGLTGELDAAAWRLNVGGLSGRTDDLVLTMDDIRRLPRIELITEFKCIEGWSNIVKWAGVRFADFVAAYPPQTLSGAAPDVANRPGDLLPYVSLVTPDEQYYVGWDMPSIMHPQTLLAYELNDQPLTPDHGAPLRLASATKYGIKQLKRIGRIEYTRERPRDYWAEEGYDWYAGH